METKSDRHNLFASFPDAIVIIASQGEIIDLNVEAEALLNVEADVITGRNVYEIALPGKECIHDYLKRCSSAAPGTIIENQKLRFFEKSGNEIIVEARASIQRTNGADRFIQCIFRDVSTQETSAIKTLESERWLRSALESTELGVWEWDLRKGRVTVNRRWGEILGLTLEGYEIPDKLWNNLVCPEDIDRVRDAHLSLVNGNTDKYESELRLITRDGGWKWILAVGRIVEYDKNGNPTRIMGTHMDIDERKRAEEEKEKLQRQLLYSQKMDAVGGLAGGIAHEFNNILAIIIGNAQIRLRKMRDGEVGYHEFREIDAAASRAQELTNRLMTLARRDKLNVKHLHVKNVVNNTITLLKLTLPENIDVEADLKDLSWGIRVDASQIQQAILNICNNACDAMPEGGTLGIKTYNVVLDEEYCNWSTDTPLGIHCCIEISDTGTGMTEEIVEKIFDPFFTTKTDAKNTGLGLSITFGIIGNHGGFVKVSSSVGKGTTFKIYLPSSPKCIEGEKHYVEETPLIGKGLILIVDDEHSVLKLTGSVLRAKGYEIVEADRGKKAVEIFMEAYNQIDLVLLDYVMPEMDGKDVFHKLKEIDPDVNVVLSSGFSLDGQAEKLLEEGVKSFLQKPYDINALYSTVNKALNKKPAH